MEGANLISEWSLFHVSTPWWMPKSSYKQVNFYHNILCKILLGLEVQQEVSETKQSIEVAKSGGLTLNMCNLISNCHSNNFIRQIFESYQAKVNKEFNASNF